ncbi:hypothetical protein EYF80_054660 [Liparis tanakae]|uniref:Uncharacterized protein n=1 Tax=Liparis tanakae TaxID=230148 RepID=A0A4Z2F3V1_9TELE|nr:hypothetical protein EYF80_054660 [Liparis tanakae]
MTLKAPAAPACRLSSLGSSSSEPGRETSRLTLRSKVNVSERSSPRAERSSSLTTRRVPVASGAAANRNEAIRGRRATTVIEPLNTHIQTMKTI